MLTRLLTLSLVTVSVMLAQNAGVQGVVTDSSSAAVPGATVSIANVDTGVTATASTNQEGRYAFPSLIPGRYRMECSAPGFAAQ